MRVLLLLFAQVKSRPLFEGTKNPAGRQPGGVIFINYNVFSCRSKTEAIFSHDACTWTAPMFCATMGIP